MAHAKESKPPNLDHVAANAKTPSMDGIVNPRTGHGTARSKQAGVWFQPRLLTPTDALTIYLASDMAQIIVDKPAEDMTRKGVCVRIPDDAEAGQEITAALGDLDAMAALMNAVRFRRMMGGAVILVNVTDGITDARQPLNEAGLISVDSLTVFEAGEACVRDWIANPTEKGFGTPNSYQITPRVIGANSAQFLDGVHHSRVIRISGPNPSRSMLANNHGFGLSVLDRVWEVISRFDQNYLSAGALIDDFAQAVFKIKGLYQSMTQNAGAAIKKRLELMDAYRSSLRGIALDADGEDFDRKPTPMSGLHETLQQFAQRLAAAAGMPLSILMGQAPTGLSAGSAASSDMEAWFSTIENLQTLELKPALNRLVYLIQKSKKGPSKGTVAKKWSVDFNPLWQPTQKEQAETRFTMAQADAIYLERGVTDPSEIRESRFGGEEWSLNTQLDDVDMGDADDLNETEGTTRLDPTTGLPVQVMPGETEPGKPGALPAPVPGAKPGAPGGATPADQAMNGIQVTSMVAVVTAVVKGEISRESGVAILKRAFRVSDAEAAEILGPENFEPEPDPVVEAKVEGIKNPKPIPGQPGAPKPAVE